MISKILRLLLLFTLLSFPVNIDLFKIDTVSYKVVSDINIKCLATAVWYEARSESLLAKRAVIDVIKNRSQIKHKTECEIVSEPQQFSWYYKGIKWKDENELLTEVDLLSKMAPVVPNATYFHDTSTVPWWARKMSREKKVGNFIFYKERK